MALLNLCGFEIGDLSESRSTSGTVSCVTTPVKSGGFALKVSPTTTNMASVRFSGFNASTGDHVADLDNANLWVSFDFRYAVKPSSNDEPICSIFTTGGSNKLQLRINSSGNLAAYYSAYTLLATGTATLAQDTWYRIDIRCGTGTSATYEVRVNGTRDGDLYSTTANLNATNAGNVYLGKLNNANGNTVEYYYDNLFIDDAGYVGTTAEILRMDPAGDGAQTAWTLQGGTGSDWENVDELRTATDDSYLRSTKSIGDESAVTLETCATAGISGTIAGVKVISVHYGDPAGTFLQRVRSDVSGTPSTSDSADWATPTSSALPRSRMLNTDPDTSSAWTTTGLDDVELAVVERETTDYSRWYSGFLMVGFVPDVASPTAYPFYYYAQL